MVNIIIIIIVKTSSTGTSRKNKMVYNLGFADLIAFFSKTSIGLSWNDETLVSQHIVTPSNRT